MSKAGQQYEHVEKGVPKWVIKIGSSGATLHHVECSGQVAPGGGACDRCVSMWICTHSTQETCSDSTQGSTQTPFYSHVVYTLRQYGRSDSFPQYGGSSLSQRSNWRKTKAEQRAIDKADCERQVAASQDPQMLRVLSMLADKWDDIPPIERDTVYETIFNMGRVGMQRRGRRWRLGVSQHHARKVILHEGVQRLKELDLNGHPLPCRNTAYKQATKFTTWGLQLLGFDIIERALPDVAVYFTMDEMAVDPKFVPKWNAQKRLHVIHGNANVVSSAKHGDGVEYTFAAHHQCPDLTDVPLATQVMTWVGHTPVRGTPVSPVWCQPTDSTLVFQDFALTFLRIELECASRGVTVAGVGGDNNPVQLEFQLSFVRPFTVSEDRQLRAVIASTGEPAGWDQWLAVATQLKRPVGLLRQRWDKLKGSAPDATVANDLMIPYKGWPFAFNKSSIHAADKPSIPQCNTPEYRHGSRLNVKHVRDKGNKLVIWSFKPQHAPALLMDYYSIYRQGSMTGGGPPLPFTAIDQTDYTQNDERVAALCRFDIVKELLIAQPGSAGTAMATLINACYLRTFMDRAGQAPLSMGARVVLGMFYVSGLISQRVMVIKHTEYKANLNCPTAPTTQATIMHIASFIGILLNGGTYFEGKSIVPQQLGEWHNEGLHSSARDPNNTRTDTVTACAFLERLGKIVTNKEWERSHDGYWTSAQSHKSYRLHSEHPNQHASYNTPLSATDIHNAMDLGWHMWVKVAMQHGYGVLLNQFTDFQSLMAEFVKCTHLTCGAPSWRDVHEFVCSQSSGDVVLEQLQTTNVTKARFGQELSAFFDACDCLINDSSLHTEAGEAASAEDQDTQGDSVAHTSFGTVMSAAHRSVARYNEGHQKQTRNLLERHQQGNMPVLDSFVKASPDGGESIQVGQSYAFLFVSQVRGRDVVSLYVGCVRSLISTSLASRGGKKPRRRFYFSLPRDDVAGWYLCHPYAKVSTSHVSTTSRSVKLEVCTNETHQYYNLVDASASGADLLHECETDSDSERDDDSAAVTATSSSRGVAATNVKSLVYVEWSGADGPTVLEENCEALLRLYDYATATGSSRPPIPRIHPAVQPAQQQTQHEQQQQPIVPVGTEHEVQPVSQRGRVRRPSTRLDM